MKQRVSYTRHVYEGQKLVSSEDVTAMVDQILTLALVQQNYTTARVNGVEVFVHPCDLDELEGRRTPWVAPDEPYEVFEWGPDVGAERLEDDAA